MSSPDLSPERMARASHNAIATHGMKGLEKEITEIIPTVLSVYKKHAQIWNNKHESKINLAKIAHINGAQEIKGHGCFSLHTTGYAIDFRTIDLPGGGNGSMAKLIAADLRKALGKEYLVLLHRPPDPMHIHIQWQHGIRMRMFPAKRERSTAIA
jgi:hypothetical protein